MSGGSPNDRLVRIETRLEAIEGALGDIRGDLRPMVLSREAEIQREADLIARLVVVEKRAAITGRRLDRVMAWAAGVAAGVSAAASAATSWLIRSVGSSP